MMTSARNGRLSIDARISCLVELANSEHLGEDALEKPGAVPEWWAQLTGTSISSTRCSRAAWQALLELREAVRRSAHGNTAGAELAELLTRTLLSATLVADGQGAVSLRPSSGSDVGWEVCGVLAESLLVSQSSSDWWRVRACAAPDCGWVFVDRSKNGSRRWCDMGSCGNRAKLRSYRLRQHSVRSTVSSTPGGSRRHPPAQSSS